MAIADIASMLTIWTDTVQDHLEGDLEQESDARKRGQLGRC